MSNNSHEANVIRGHKAAMHNPRVSEEAKEHSRKIVENYEMSAEDPAHESHVLAGYKATLSNARTSEEAKEHAREVLEEHGVKA